MADKTLRSITFPGLGDRYVIPEQVSIDATLSQQGKAADAKAVGDAISKGNLNQHIKVNPFVIGNNAQIGTAAKNRSNLEVQEDGSLKLTSTAGDTSSTYGCYFRIETDDSVDVTGHKLYIKLSGLDFSGAAHFSNLRIYGSLNATTSGIPSTNIITDPTVTEFEQIFTPNANMNQFNILLGAGTTGTDGEYFSIGYALLIDLTAMFGAGYEPDIDTFTRYYNGVIAFRLPELSCDIKQVNTQIDAAIGRFKSDVDAELEEINSEIEEANADIQEIGKKLDNKAPIIINMVSGDIASFSDGADSMPMKSLVATIEPVQDLHGFDHPWPAGSGKNKLNNFISSSSGTFAGGIAWTLNSDGSITVNGTATTTDNLYINANAESLPAGNYILNGCPNGGSSSTYRLVAAINSGASYAVDVGSGAALNLQEGDTFRCYIRINSGTTINATYYPMIRLATEVDETYEPYSNICPITGRTGLSGKRTGKNLAYFANGTKSSAGVAFVFADGVITANGTASGNALSGNDNLYLPAGTYRVFNLAAQSDGAYINVQNSEDSAAWPILANTSGSLTDTFTLTRWTKLSVHARIPSGVTATNMVFKPMIVAGTAAPAEFEPNVSQDISVNWQSQAGTVYGGTVDVVSGKLVADRAIVTGTWSKSPNYNHVFYRTGIGNKTFPVLVLSDVISNILPTVQANSLSALDNMDYGIRVTDIIYAVNKDCSTAEEFNTWATQNDLQVVYTLATPIEYQLTPQEVTTLLGNNVVYTDVGPVSVTAPRDTKMYVDNKIAEAVAAALNA